MIVVPRVHPALLAIAIGGFFLWWLSDVVTPIFLAYLIAYVFDPVIDKLEAWKIRRPLGILIVLIVSIGGTALFLALVLPTIAADVASAVRELPGKVSELWGSFVPWLEERGVEVPHSTTEWVARLSTNADSVANAVSPEGGLLTLIIGWIFSLIGSALAALILPVLAVYFLNDFDRISAGVLQLVPPRHRAAVTSYAVEIHNMLRQFLRGQVTVMAILGMLYGGAYTLLGIRLAAPIGIAAGVLHFIPYLGSAFALVAGLMMSLLEGWHPSQLLGVVIAYAAVQTLEGFVITPRIVGRNVHISGTWVLVALFVGGEIFGFLGVLLALPVVAVAKIFVSRLLARYQESDLFLAPADTATDEQPPANS
ncbi:MAG TPA: AI-2E family transporter [Polyangiaceae bacterium]|nr:AI-2E family transporter [Polyangiaceae bacterium]